MARKLSISLPAPITEQLIKDLAAQGVKPASGRGKLGFPTSAPGPWAKLADGSFITAVEKGDVLVAV